jgi:hypothetical protein
MLTTTAGSAPASSDSSDSHRVLPRVQDRQLLMWDLRTCQAQATMEVPAQPFAVMDEEGLVFTVACSSGLVSMFDARSYAAGPFLSFPIPLTRHGLHESSPISCMKFSTSQQHLLVVVEGKIFVMDTFDGREVVTWDTGIKAGMGPVEASFSADGEFAISGVRTLRLLATSAHRCRLRANAFLVIIDNLAHTRLRRHATPHNISGALCAGTADKRVAVWKCPPVPPEGAPPAPLAPEHMTPVTRWKPHPCIPVCAKFSPTRKLAVTACRALVIWIPAEGDKS